MKNHVLNKLPVFALAAVMAIGGPSLSAFAEADPGSSVDTLLDEFQGTYTALFPAFRDDRYDAMWEKSLSEYAAVNAENAEIYYLNGFWVKGKTIPANAEEAYGRYFFKFLKEEYGDNFFQMYVRKTNAYGVLGNFSTIMKATYGDDVFTRFGDWCVENQVLQYVTEEEQ